MSLAQVAAHEAAHAVVAAHYGVPVLRVVAGERSGFTEREDVGTTAQAAAITAAGEVGQRLAGGRFFDLACGDLADFEARFGLGRLWRAQRDAREILTARRAAWLDLAAWLVRERRIEF
ncbi:hypothetical protein SAMN04489713_104264 [Actinomadura madurae]|uniref:Peptidase family M41 n=1 Tax=Actinomadura madurae TaxID=1993 RepID=A0A1I5ETW9_9ACTN|nr:hypothetical protein SAMN04489713_104264 [Actinomadura madurae]